MAVVATVIITGGVIVMAMAVVAAVMAVTPGKGSEKNPEKSSPRRKKGIPLGLPTQKEAQIGVISTSLNTLPA